MGPAAQTPLTPVFVAIPVAWIFVNEIVWRASDKFPHLSQLFVFIWLGLAGLGLLIGVGVICSRATWSVPQRAIASTIYVIVMGCSLGLISTIQALVAGYI